jgi:hypothetical protein
MQSVLDDLLVGGLILISVVYATYSLGPKALRQRLALGTAVVLRKLPAILHLQCAALRLEAASQKAGGSCGGCDNCGSAPGATGTKSTTAATGSAAAPSTEIHIPVSTIRRR